MKVVLSMAVIVMSAAIAVGGAGAQDSKFPEGPGKAILERACGACHGADVVTKYHFETPQEYKDIIDSMIGSGAQVSPTESPVLVDYLFKNYGKKPEPGKPDPGKAILEMACTACHGLDGLANHVYTEKGPYESLVDNMIAYGAAVTAEQKPALVDYMFKTYGKK